MTLFRSFFSRIAVVAAGLAVFVSGGCSTDLDPNADYKETMVIYSVLNPRETVHYAKVTKAFLNTNSNAYTIAANSPDSTFYGPEVKVVLQKLTITNGDTTVKPSDEYPMVRIDTTGKEAGTFFSGSQVVYRTQPGKPGKLDDKAIYRVVAKNEKTGVVASGVTPLVQEGIPNTVQSFCISSISLSTPEYSANKYCFSETSPSVYEPQANPTNPGSKNRIIFRQALNASIYTIKTIFVFSETNNGVDSEKQVEWYEANNFVFDPAPDAQPADKNRTVEIPLNSFYTKVAQLINTNNDNASTSRKAKYVLVKITAGSESLRKNFLANNSYSVFSQTRPEFDNITNGTGLVGSRVTQTAKGLFSSAAELKLINEFPQLKFK